MGIAAAVNEAGVKGLAAEDAVAVEVKEAAACRLLLRAPARWYQGSFL